MTRRLVEERLGWLRSQIESRDRSECWDWPFYVHPSGHAKIGRGRLSAAGNRITEPAYRVAWELDHGVAFPAGRYACHTCSNKKCVNPDHIYVGTHLTNMRDAAAKAEMSRGEAHGMCKITKEMAIEIDRRLRSGQAQRSIAADMGINRSTVRHLSQGHSWSWLTGRPNQRLTRT